MSQPFNGDVFLEKTFLELRDKFKIERVIETGTYHGYTTKWLSENFPHVATIESNLDHLRIAQLTLSNTANVTQIDGDSSKDLIHLLKASEGKRLLIFLDAHWYKNPVLAELDQIKESGLKPVLVIHDFKNPTDPTMGYDKYPDQKITYDWPWIEDKIWSIYGEEFQVSYNTEATGARRGCIFITPNV